MESNGTEESKIIFEENNETRVLRGVIVSEDSFFVTVKRRDGIFKIAKRTILRIEHLNHAEDRHVDR